jgi:type III secretory pathway component EscT
LGEQFEYVPSTWIWELCAQFPWFTPVTPSSSGSICSNGLGLAGIPETSDPLRKENSNTAEIIGNFMFVRFFISTAFEIVWPASISDWRVLNLSFYLSTWLSGVFL